MTLDIKISIITPAFNASSSILKVYDSLKNQKYNNFEWIVVDDCSTDNTCTLIMELIPKSPFSIVFIENKENIGAALSRNVALDRVNGDYICFLDADDYWESDKLLLQLNYMESTGAKITYMDYRHIDSEGNFIKNIVPKEKCSKKSLLKSNCIGNLTCMVNFELIEDLRFMKHGHEDYIFWLKVLEKTPYAFKVETPTPLCNYTISSGSLSGNKFKAAAWQWSIYRNIIGLSFFDSCYCFFIYAVSGILKHK